MGRKHSPVGLLSSLCEIHNHAFHFRVLSGAHSFWPTYTVGEPSDLWSYRQHCTLIYCSSTPDRERTYSCTFLYKRNRKITEFVPLNAVETESNALVLMNAILYVMCFYNWWLRNTFKAVRTLKQTNKEEDGSYYLQRKPTLEHKPISGSDSILYAKVQPEL